MAQICGFGTAPEQKKEGFRGIGTVKGTDDDVLSQFFSDEVRLVRGGELASSPGKYEFFVMIRDEVAPLQARIAQLEKMVSSSATTTFIPIEDGLPPEQENIVVMLESGIPLMGRNIFGMFCKYDSINDRYVEWDETRPWDGIESWMKIPERGAVSVHELRQKMGFPAPDRLSVEGRVDAGHVLIMNTEIPPETKVLLPDGRVGYMEEFCPEESEKGEYAYSVWVLKDPLNESLGGEYFMYDRDELSRLDGKLYGIVRGDLANKSHLESLGVEVAGYSESDRAFRVSMSEAVMREVLKFGADYAVDALFRQECAGQIPHKEMTQEQLAAETAYYDFMIAACVPYTPNSTSSESWYAAHGGFPGSPDIPPATVFMDLKKDAETLLASVSVIDAHPPCQNFAGRTAQSDPAP